MFSRVPRNVGASFNLYNRAQLPYNDNLKDLTERREYNTKSVYCEPDVIKRNVDFFSCLSVVGIVPLLTVLKPVFAPHNKRFHLLENLKMRGETKPIIGFKVPELFNQVMYTGVAGDTMTYDNGNVSGKGNHLLYRARETLGGVECVVFAVEYTDGVKHYMWDECSIYEVTASGPARFERAGGKLYLLSDIDNYKIGMPFIKHRWENLNQELVDTAAKGITVTVDTEEFKIDRVLTSVVKLIDNRIVTDDNQLLDELSEDKKDGNYNMDLVNDVILTETIEAPENSDLIRSKKRCALRYREIPDKFLISKEKRFMDAEIIISTVRNGKFFTELNKGKIYVAGLVPRDKENWKLRVDHVRYLIDVEGKLGKNRVENALANLYPRNGRLYNLRISDKKYCDGGLSNIPLPGYEVVTCDEVDKSLEHFFAYNGIFVLYYDPGIWGFDANVLMELDHRKKDYWVKSVDITGCQEIEECDLFFKRLKV